MDKFNLRGHQKKCRCCFQSFHRQQKHVKITEDIKTSFYSVTQVELKTSASYSDEICLMCLNELSSYVEFKNKITERQLELYKKIPDAEVKQEEPEIDIFQVNIKQEPETFSSDDGFDNLNDNDEKPVKKQTRERKKQTKVPMKKGRKPGQRFGEIPEKLCPDCGIYYKRRKAHIRKYHAPARRFICDYCGYNNRRRCNLQEHIINKHFSHLAETFLCHLCNFSTVYKSSLRGHLKDHDRVKRDHVCHCGKSFKTKYVLAHHIKITHEGVRNFFCKFCSNTYVSKHVLNTHILIKHSKHVEKEKVCEICAKTFFTLDQLKSHLRLTHTLGKLKCDVEGCNKIFHRKFQLERHMSTHTKLSNYHCNQCSVSFRHQTTLVRHIDSAHKGLRLSLIHI